jgi:hypothetical protein
MPVIYLKPVAVKVYPDRDATFRRYGSILPPGKA